MLVSKPSALGPALIFMTSSVYQKFLRESYITAALATTMSLMAMIAIAHIASNSVCRLLHYMLALLAGRDHEARYQRRRQSVAALPYENAYRPRRRRRAPNKRESNARRRLKYLSMVKYRHIIIEAASNLRRAAAAIDGGAPAIASTALAMSLFRRLLIFRVRRAAAHRDEPLTSLDQDAAQQAPASR